MDIREFRNALEKLATSDNNMPLTAIQTLVWVASNEGKHQIELERYLGLSNATTSRAVAWWGDWRSFKDKRRGPGFIETYADPADKRFRVIRLTPAGRSFVDELFKETQKDADTTEAR